MYWIDSAWNAITQATIQNTFRSAGFERRSLINEAGVTQMPSTASVLIHMEDRSIEELDRVLDHLTIGGKTMSAYDYVVRD